MNKGMYSSKSGEGGTPQELFNRLNKEFNFDLDPCSTHKNAKCIKHYTKQENGLILPWYGAVFMNPPYGRVIKNWVAKAYIESQSNAITVVCLLPARTDTRWFHEYIYRKFEIRFLKGRLKFSGYKGNAPFPSMIVVMKGEGL